MNWQEYLDANPDLAAYWQGLAPQHKAEFDNSPALFAEWHYNTMGAAEGRQQPAAPAPALGPQDVLDQVEGSPLARYARDDLNWRNKAIGDQYGDELEFNANRFNDESIQTAASELRLRGEADSAYGAQIGAANAARADLEGVGVGQYGAELTDASFARNDRLGLADTAYNDMQQVGHDAYAGRRALLEDDWTTRKGYTDTAINDRAQLNDIYQGQARDRIASMLGVNGQVGKAARAGAERANELDLEFSDTVRGWRNQDYDPYATGKYAAYGDLARINEGATGTRSGERLDAANAYAGARANATSALWNNRQNAAGAYASANANATDARAQRYGQYAENAANADAANQAQYYAGAQAANRAQWGGYNTAYDNYAAGKANAYGDWANAYSNAADRGFNAMQLGVNAGQVSTNNIATANNQSAQAFAQGQYDRADANSNMWNNIGSALGNFGGYKWGGQGGGQPAPSTAYGSYNPTTYRAPMAPPPPPTWQNPFQRPF